MGLLVLGDAHAGDEANREALLAAYRAADADHALHVGDLEYYDLPAPTWFVAGNNEDFDVIESMRGNETLDRWTGESTPANAHLLASTAETLRVSTSASASPRREAAEVEELRVAGLSGNYAPTQYEKSRDELTGERRRHFVREDVERAERLEDVDVFLAHEAPRALLGGLGKEPIDRVIEALEPDLCLTGHHHRHVEGSLGETRLVGLAPVWDSYYLLDPETLALERRETPGCDE